MVEVVVRWRRGGGGGHAGGGRGRGRQVRVVAPHAGALAHPPASNPPAAAPAPQGRGAPVRRHLHVLQHLRGDRERVSATSTLIKKSMCETERPNLSATHAKYSSLGSYRMPLNCRSHSPRLSRLSAIHASLRRVAPNCLPSTLNALMSYKYSPSLHGSRRPLSTYPITPNTKIHSPLTGTIAPPPPLSGPRNRNILR